MHIITIFLFSKGNSQSRFQGNLFVAWFHLYCSSHNIYQETFTFWKQNQKKKKPPSVLWSFRERGKQCYNLLIIPTVPLHCNNNVTLNHCHAPSGFITRWQPLVRSLWSQQVGVWREGGVGESEADGTKGWQWCHFTPDPPPVAWRRLMSQAFDACCDECDAWKQLSLTAPISSLIELSRLLNIVLCKQTLAHCSSLFEVPYL